MKPLFAALCATALACAVLPAAAQQSTPAGQPSAAQAAQQERMKGCNTNATALGLKGDARKMYMSPCLSGTTNQQTIMKVCNAEAGQDKMTGEARKSFMKVCLRSTS